MASGGKPRLYLVVPQKKEDVISYDERRRREVTGHSRFGQMQAPSWQSLALGPRASVAEVQVWVETKIARLEGPVNERTFRTDEEFERCGHAGSGQPGLTADSQRRDSYPCPPGRCSGGDLAAPPDTQA